MDIFKKCLCLFVCTLIVTPNRNRAGSSTSQAGALWWQQRSLPIEQNRTSQVDARIPLWWQNPDPSSSRPQGSVLSIEEEAAGVGKLAWWQQTAGEVKKLMQAFRKLPLEKRIEKIEMVERARIQKEPTSQQRSRVAAEKKRASEKQNQARAYQKRIYGAEEARMMAAKRADEQLMAQKSGRQGSNSKAVGEFDATTYASATPLERAQQALRLSESLDATRQDIVKDFTLYCAGVEKELLSGKISVEKKRNLYNQLREELQRIAQDPAVADFQKQYLIDRVISVGRQAEIGQ